MTKSNQHSIQHLTAEKMVAYLNGTLSSAEVHALEKHLLNCPLCEEAIEGYENAGNQQHIGQELSELSSKLADKLKDNNNKRIVAYWKYAVAASILLALGGYWYTYTNWDRLAENEIAQAPENIDLEEKKVEFGTSPDTIDSISVLPSEPFEKPSGKSEDRLAIEREVDNVVKPAVSAPIIEQTNEIAEKDIQLPEPIVVEDEEVEEVEIVKKEIVDEATLDNDQIIVNSEKSDKNFATEVKAMPMKAMDEVESVQSESTAKQNISKLSTVSVGKRKAKNRKKARPTFASASGDDKLAKMNATPKKGKEAYDEYLRDELKYPTAAKENKIEGEVIVSFLINKKGDLSDFKIVKGLGYGCDEESIRLIREGPKWLPASNNGDAILERKELSVFFAIQ